MSKFQEYLQNSHKILLISSDPLDLDSISSGVVMKKYLQSLGLEVVYRFPRKLLEVEIQNYKSLPYFEEVVCEDTSNLINQGDFDTLVLLDSGSWMKFYDSSKKSLDTPKIPRNKKIIRVDHHKDGSDDFGNLQIVNVNSSSTIEIILTEIVPIEFLDIKLANLAYFGILGDTGNFKWNFFPNTFKIASMLLEKGANPQEMIERGSLMKESDIQALSYVLSNLENDPETKTTFLFLSYEKLQQDNITEEFLVLIKKAFKDRVGRYIEGFPRAIVVVESEKGNLEVSSRGANFTNKIDFTALFKGMGGLSGGHFLASGMHVKANFDEFKEKLTNKLKLMLQEVDS